MPFPVTWPKFGQTDSYHKAKFAEPLQAEGNLSYLEFISVLKTMWEESFPNYPVKPSANTEPSFTWFNKNYVDPETGNVIGRYEQTDAIITFSLELRKAHAVEPKPRMRRITNNEVYIYGQRFQNIIAFSAISPVGKRMGDSTNLISDDQDNSYLVESLIETFEDFMLEYTPIFKKIGASELTYARRLSDSEVNRDQKDVHKRTVTYMLTTEKTFAAQAGKVESLSLDIRMAMAYESAFLNHMATPNYDGTTISLTDLSVDATPNA